MATEESANGFAGSSDLDRRQFLRSVAAIGAVNALSSRTGVEAGVGLPSGRSAPGSVVQASFALHEITIAGLQKAYAEKRFTSAQVVDLYLDRIAAIDRSGPSLRSILELNPDAHDIAHRLDAERAAGKVRGPLHGVPIVLKDVIDTADRMHTTAGSLALLGSLALRDAFVVEQLRAAGAIILGKTNLSEWSNCRAMNGTSGWSARGGVTKNPYVLDRTACGSSSGTAVAVSANLTLLGVGAETDGSISCPASANGLVGVKPTVGLVSRAGLIPVSFSQDSAGPLTRTVTDAAILLGVMAGADSRDIATSVTQGHAVPDYVGGLDKGALKGARIGVQRIAYESSLPAARVMAHALDVMRDAGATIVDEVQLPSIDEIHKVEVIVLLCEFKDLIAQYLATRGPEERHRTLSDLIRFNIENAETELRYFGQEWFEASEVTSGRRTPDYPAALARCRLLTRTMGIDKALNENRLDSIVLLAGGPAFPTDLINGDRPMPTGASVCSVAGYPRVTVPAGQVLGLPVGISFTGPAWSEMRMLSLAYAFEQVMGARVPPHFLPTANVESSE